MRSLSLLTLLFTLIALLTLAAAQSAHPSPTPRRRSPGPAPTSIDQITDPELLELLAPQYDTQVDHSPDSSGTGAVSRSRSRKIKGFGHEADQLPLTNAERIRLGIPLKPPAAKKSKSPAHTMDESADELHAEDGGWNWLEGEKPF
jgi:hypothetical protein